MKKRFKHTSRLNLLNTNFPSALSPKHNGVKILRHEAHSWMSSRNRFHGRTRMLFFYNKRISPQNVFNNVDEKINMFKLITMPNSISFNRIKRILKISDDI